MAVTGNTARIEDALLGRLASLVLAPARRVAWPDIVFEPVVGEVYLAPGTLWNSAERGEVGPGAARRYVGIFQVLVRGPISGTSVPQKEAADSIIEHFDRQNLAYDGLIVRIGSFNGGRAVPWRGGALVDAGWRLIPVSVPFWCDVFPS